MCTTLLVLWMQPTASSSSSDSSVEFEGRGACTQVAWDKYSLHFDYMLGTVRFTLCSFKTLKRSATRAIDCRDCLPILSVVVVMSCSSESLPLVRSTGLYLWIKWFLVSSQWHSQGGLRGLEHPPNWLQSDLEWESLAALDYSCFRWTYYLCMLEH